MTFPMMCLGAHGTISAVANVIGKEFTAMCDAVKSDRIEDAKKIHYQMLPLVRALFIETNPVPVKEALSMMGLPAGPPRLPLVPLKAENRAMLAEELRRAGRLRKD